MPDTVQSIPELVPATYAKMERGFNIVRRRLGRRLTPADKLLLGYLENPDREEVDPGRSHLQLRSDRVVLRYVLGQTPFLQFMHTRRERTAGPTTIHCDHLIQARIDGEADLCASLADNTETYDLLRWPTFEYGADLWEPGAGIIHRVVLEYYAFPGRENRNPSGDTPWRNGNPLL